MPNKDQDITQVLQLNTPIKKRRKWLIIGGSVLLLAGLLNVLFVNHGEQPIAPFETVPIKRADLTAIVTATGKLEPVTQVDIGIEVSGTAEEILADFNDHVKAGQVLAKLDSRIFDAKVKQSQGVLDQAKAKLHDAEATIAEKQQALAFMQTAREMSGGKLPAKQDIVKAEADLKRALALKNQIQGNITQAEGQLKLDQTNLVKSSIRTPIDGIVLDRKIEKGQTVAATLQTPIMFTVAKNLTEMELHVDVDEADVGKIQLGQPSSFTVDAYPDKTFPAKISEIRYAPKTVNGVVTYETVLLVDNADLFLRPGMTATADMVVNQAQDVLAVPNAALRFSLDEASLKKPERSFVEKLLPTPPRSAVPKTAHDNKRREKPAPQIWLLDNNQPKAVAVKVGLSDDALTEVSTPELKEGMSVIIDTVSQKQ